MREKESASARSPNVVPCENPECGKPIELDESLLAPDADIPEDHIHTRYDPKTSSFSALCRQCHHFTVSLSEAGQNPISALNSPPTVVKPRPGHDDATP